jgi:hypothetical protein
MCVADIVIGRMSVALKKGRYLASMLGAVVSLLVWLVGLPVADVAAQAQTCPCTIWPSTAAPTNMTSPDPTPFEVGVKFRSDTSGYISGVRFYKLSNNTGTHLGHLWSSTGSLLATATFTSETTSGWQQVNFGSAVAITANMTYVASYFAPNGHYTDDLNFFTSAGVDRAPLHALSNTAGGGNGVYANSGASGFPNNTYQSSNYWVDVVFSTTAPPTSTPTSTPTPQTCPCTIWPSTAAPTNTNGSDPSAIEVGVKFRADSNGFINGVRFYKLSSNTGTHIGNLWSSSGALMATATFAGESASGWQQVTFSAPVAVTANTTYVVSYFSPTGHYATDQNYFATVGVDRAPLHALSNAAGGGNGVYVYASGSAFPNNSYLSSNYWVDVAFGASTGPTNTPTATPTRTNTPTPTNTAIPGTPTNTPVPTNTPTNTVAPTNTPTTGPSSCPCTIWPSGTTPTNQTSSDTSAIELGVKFTSDVSGYISGIRYYKLSNNTGTHIGSLWSSTGTSLVSATFTGETATGWQQVNFASPYPIAANTTYIASYHTNTGGYADDLSYFTAGVNRAPLHAPSDASSGGNGVYAYSASRTFPNSAYSASNYWVDVVLTTTPPGPTTISGVSASNIGTTSTNILWTTNNLANSQVQYGTTVAYSSSTALDSTLVTSHSQTLTGLSAGTLYHYRVLSRDSGNTLVTSPDATFTTLTVSATGTWSAVMNWPLVAVHSALLNNGKVLMWDAWETGGTPSARVWDPVTKAFTSVPDNLTQIFCAGQVQLDDGRILVIGGHNGGEFGIPATTIFNPATNTWSTGAAMNSPRWYPMATKLPDGRVVTIGGNMSPGVFANTPEVYDPGSDTWSTINVNTSDVQEENYPLGFVLPTGNVFVIGPDQGNTRILNVNAQTWTTAVSGTAPVIFGSAIQYRPGQFLYTGGSHATNSETTAAVLDMNQPTPAWTTIAPMAFARTFHSMVSLPDGNVLVVGGGGTNQQTNTVAGPLRPELWNPTTQAWTTLAPMHNPRMYHSTATLLPDATVLVAGGGKLSPAIDYPNAEIFSPPYLSSGTRPTISSAPTTATIASSITVQTPDAASIGSVSLVALSSDTHNYDMAQRFVPLTFTAGSGSLNVQMPNSVNLAPPGNYMLFIVNTNGVPSVAPIVRVTANNPGAPPTLSSIGSSGLGGYSATVNWNTDRIATSQVDYGTTTAYGTSSPLNTSHSIGHSVQLLDLSPNTTYHYRVRSTDTFGNTAVSSDFTFATTVAPTCPCNIFTPSAAPTTPLGNDGLAIELGVKFIAEHDGFINGIRFYKASGNGGTHTGHLWTTDGTLLRSATFSAESATGWQQVNFSSPVAITAGTTYVASYLSGGGTYSATVGTFATSGVDRTPLHALSSSAAGGNGVYTYTSSGALPDQTYNAANYWVDVVFTLTGTGASMTTAFGSQADATAAAPPSEKSTDQAFTPPATKGAAMQLITLGLIKPHSAEHEVSFWCPLATSVPGASTVTWQPDGVAPPVIEREVAPFDPTPLVWFGLLALALGALTRRLGPRRHQVGNLLRVLRVMILHPAEHIGGTGRVRVARA